MRMTSKWTVYFLCLLLIQAAVCRGQTPELARLRDQSSIPPGRPVANVPVLVENQATDTARSVITNPSGSFTVPFCRRVSIVCPLKPKALRRAASIPFQWLSARSARFNCI